MAEVTKALIMLFVAVSELIYAGFNWGNNLRCWYTLRSDREIEVEAECSLVDRGLSETWKLSWSIVLYIISAVSSSLQNACLIWHMNSIIWPWSPWDLPELSGQSVQPVSGRPWVRLPWGLRTFFFSVFRLENASPLFTLNPSHQSIHRLNVICLPTEHKEFSRTRLKGPCITGSNWNLEMLVFEKGKPK